MSSSIHRTLTVNYYVNYDQATEAINKTGGTSAAAAIQWLKDSATVPADVSQQSSGFGSSAAANRTKRQFPSNSYCDEPPTKRAVSKQQQLNCFLSRAGIKAGNLKVVKAQSREDPCCLPQIHRDETDCDSEETIIEQGDKSSSDTLRKEILRRRRQVEKQASQKLRK